MAGFAVTLHGRIWVTPEAIASQIANGHSWDKHQGEFPGWSQGDFQRAVEETIQSPDDVKGLSDGRTAYWNDKESMVVIHDPSSPDGGTAFRPTDGKAYFDSPNLR
jgi:filamentous hemagglutinin